MSRRSGAGPYASKAEAMAGLLLTAGEETLPRWEATSNSVVTLSTQVLRLHFFVARRTEPITQVRVPTGTTAAAATPTLCRVGLYSIAANGDGTLLAAIANDTTLWAAANTDYLRTLTSTFNKVANQKYALGALCVTAAASPVLGGSTVFGGAAPGGTAAARAPRLAGSLAGQADLPASFTDASLAPVAFQIYAELVP